MQYERDLLGEILAYDKFENMRNWILGSTEPLGDGLYDVLLLYCLSVGMVRCDLLAELLSVTESLSTRT